MSVEFDTEQYPEYDTTFGGWGYFKYAFLILAFTLQAHGVRTAKSIWADPTKRRSILFSLSLGLIPIISKIIFYISQDVSVSLKYLDRTKQDYDYRRNIQTHFYVFMSLIEWIFFAIYHFFLLKVRLSRLVLALAAASTSQVRTLIAANYLLYMIQALSCMFSKNINN
jgi:hypothetical protein